jgi:hypothetical protein
MVDPEMDEKPKYKNYKAEDYIDTDLSHIR